eukprot:TRINITY_DN5734_c0_g1_i1.p1 TRINITY_DN5734_c0_g1~~TRINITY_DN5734_c0_g1_i1.p1  ORF type:complete len:347 (+),score=62.09 TRINITY_DN5734_c0_g1_i1:66-1106(+)
MKIAHSRAQVPAESIISGTAAGYEVAVLHRQLDIATVGSIISDGDILVHDPENKARYVVSADCCEVTVGCKDYSSKKKSFLCMLHQRGHCRAKGLCNQLHVRSEVISRLREMAVGGFSVSKTSNFVANLQVIDPVIGQKVSIPYRLLNTTVGRQDAVKGKEVSLCQHQASCRFGINCKHIHTKQAYKQLKKAPCCPMHGPGDRQSGVNLSECRLRQITISYEFGKYILRNGDARHQLSAALMSSTKGYQRLCQKEFHHAKVCIHHQEHRCLHGDLCNNVHLCRRWFAAALTGELVGSAISSSSSSASSVGEECSNTSTSARLFDDNFDDEKLFIDIENELPQLLDE